MKKLVTLILAVVTLCCTVFCTACANDEQSSINENGTVSVKYYQSASDMLPLLKKGDLTVGLLPEPAATQLTKIASDKTWTRIDVQTLYDNETCAYPQAVMMVKESLLNTYPQLVENIAQSFDSNVSWVKENVSSAVTAINGKVASGVTPSLNASNIDATVVDNCKIYYESATDAKKFVKTYIEQIISLESSSAKVVGDDFFYTGSASGQFTLDTINVVAPDGAPAIAIAKYAYDNYDFGLGKTVSYSVVNASNIGGALQKGTGDIVIIPVNAASKLYKANSSDPYKMVAVVTHGNLYLMSSKPFITLSGQTVGVIGQGLVPDLTFKVVLNKSKMGLKIAD
jgi:hypothetical protein